jgi:hypothetical protein
MLSAKHGNSFMRSLLAQSGRFEQIKGRAPEQASEK